MKDTFPYEARWDSVGLDCSNCTHFRAPSRWPDERRQLCCSLHGLSLAVELGPNGYKLGEWFCRNFSDDGTAFPKAAAHMNRERAAFAPGVLYGFYRKNGELREVPFTELSPGCRPEAAV